MVLAEVIRSVRGHASLVRTLLISAIALGDWWMKRRVCEARKNLWSFVSQGTAGGNRNINVRVSRESIKDGGLANQLR